LLSQIDSAAQEEDEHRIDSTTTKTKPPDQSELYNQIKMDLDLLLDSDDDEDCGRDMHEDGMIEKDLDNWY